MYSVEDFDKEKTRVLKYIMYQRRSEYEVRNKFLKILDEDLLEDIIEYLKQAKYIDDKEYIEHKINNFILLRNMSIKEIKYKLISKGIKQQDIEDYIYKNEEKLTDFEIKSAENIILKKTKSFEDEDLDSVKKYLYKKGYKSENIKEAIENKSQGV